MRNQVPVSRRGNFSRRLSLLVAVLVAVILVGGLAVVLNLSHQTSTTGVAGLKATKSPTATNIPKPTSTVSPGKTVYTTPSNQWGFESLAWSPDSKRVASATVDPNGVQFWDATTGDHLVTVKLPGGQSEWAYGLDWSPYSVDVVVATNLELLVVNGQTGAIIKSHSANAQTALSNAIAGHTYLTRLIPASGGYGFREAAWSPDGKLIAAALSYGVDGVVQVWNPQSDAIVYTLRLDNTDYNVGSVAWSSDGRYIAGTTWNTQGGDPTQPTTRVVTWNVSTQQLVFQHSDFTDSSAFVAWQPQSHNLAFVGNTTSGGSLVSTLEIWNATTGKLVKQFVGQGYDALAWSPDGNDLVYANFGNVVTILDVATGKQIYSYTGHHLPVSVVAWSPNGQYIASGEGNTQGQMVAKVWTA